MPSFEPLTENDLLRRYLDKDHLFRQGRTNVLRRAVVWDTWTLPSAQEAWRNFAPCVGWSNVTAASWWSIETKSSLFIYSAGYGTEESGYPPSFATRQLNAAFAFRYGSWSCDWDQADNQLRCVLAAAPLGLTCVWQVGNILRYYPMGLGETVGDAIAFSQRTVANFPTYLQVLGDPTLRAHPVLPPSNAASAVEAGGVRVTWNASPDATEGYHVYRAATPGGPYTRLTATPQATTSFLDGSPLPGTSYYQIRTIKLEAAASGSYFNQSQGVFVRHPENMCTISEADEFDGTLDPAVQHSYAFGSALTLAPSNTTRIKNGTRYELAGWTGQGDVAATGTGTNTPLVYLQQNSSIVWQWEASEHWLETGVAGSGTVSVASGWQPVGTEVSLLAMPSGGSRFLYWTGEGVPTGSETNNPLVVVMDRPRQITARFRSDEEGLPRLPFIDAFESYEPGTWLFGVNGWGAGTPNGAVVSDDQNALAALATYREPSGFPLSTNHNLIMQANAHAFVPLASPSNQVIWTDLMVQFTPWGDLDTLPTPPPHAQWAFCTGDSGTLLIWHRDMATGINRWTETEREIDPERWYRLTVTADYGTWNPPAQTTLYFQVDLDGRTLSHARAWTEPSAQSATGGTWFAAAQAADSLYQFNIQGPAFIDDVVITTNNPYHRLSPLGTPEWWLRLHNLIGDPAEAELSDVDGDGLTAWEEFVAGTDPADASSCLCFDGAATQAGERLQLDFPSQPNRWYTLEAAESLLSNNWTEIQFALDSNGSLQEGPVWSTGERLTLFVDPQGRQQCFRIRVMR